MRLRNHLLSLVVGALALLGLGGQAQALGIPVPLSSLVVPGATLTSEDGNFTFGDFGASVTGAISSNLDDYNVQALTSGFRVTGAFLVADGNFGDMVLSFSVTPKQGILITDAHLFFNGSFNGNAPPGMGTSVNETIFHNNDPIAQLSVATSSGGFQKLTDAVVFDPVPSITVLKDIALSSYGGQGGSVAHISIVDQTFTYIPEPGTLLLGSAGLLGIAVLGRKRT